MEFIYGSRNPHASTAFVSLESMHTVFEMLMVNVAEEKARNIAEDVERRLSAMQMLLDRHDARGGFAKINASSGDDAVAVDDELFSVLQFCEVFRRNTYGYFDISALSECRTTPAYRLDAAGKRVMLSGRNVILDAGGFGKGYALDRLREMLLAEGMKDCLINFGDSSVAGIGNHPFGESWSVSAKHGEGDFVLKDSSLSISGCRPDGQAHIVNPGSGEFVSKDCMIAVEGRSAFVCEVLSTALYAAPEEMRRKIAASFEGYRYRKIVTAYFAD